MENIELQEEIAPIVEKKKRIRKKKVLEKFWLQKKEGEINKITAISNYIDPQGIHDTLIMHPYNTWIPLDYLLVNTSIPNNHPLSGIIYAVDRSNISKEISENIKERCQNDSLINKALLNLIYNYPSYTAADIFPMLKDRISNFIFYNKYHCINSTYSNWTNGIDNIIDCFTGKRRASRCRNRMYAALVGCLSYYIKEDEQYVPHILAVVAPEDYIYQKMHFLLTGTFDTTKITIFANRELDNVDFPNKSFRNHWKKYFEPYINTLNLNVWRVDIEYIKKACFSKAISLESVNIIERKKEKRKIIEDFKNSYATINTEEREYVFPLDSELRNNQGIHTQIINAGNVVNVPTTISGADIAAMFNNGGATSTHTNLNDDLRNYWQPDSASILSSGISEEMRNNTFINRFNNRRIEDQIVDLGREMDRINTPMDLRDYVAGVDPYHMENTPNEDEEHPF